MSQLIERIKLEEDEQVLTIVRKHWFVIAVRTVSVATSMLTPLIAVLVVRSYLPVELVTQVNAFKEELWFLYFGWLIMNWMILANLWTDYYLDLWIITNRRIVSIDQRGFFRRFLSSFRLERLQDMNINVSGLIPTLLNYGTIEAQTAGGSNEEFKTNNMPDPRGLKALIINAADERQRVMNASWSNTQEGL
jgi:hypothetical protein